MPDPARCTDAEWAAYVFNRSGVPGVKREWWCHTPSGYWFIAERDTASDEVLASYRRAELPGRRAHDVPPAAPCAGEWIDRARALAFELRRPGIEGFAGDTLQLGAGRGGRDDHSARSFKYHRPRGIFSLANHDANNLFQIGRRAQPCAATSRRWRAMACTFSAVNTRRRRGAAIARAFIDWLARFLPVGFYYKAFHGSAASRAGSDAFARFSGLGTVDVGRAARIARRSATRSAMCW